MKAVVFYATREGHTRCIAEHIATNLRAHHVDVDLYDVKSPHVSIDWSLYDCAYVAASVHFGHHEREMIGFVRRHCDELKRLSAAFLSATLSQAGAEDLRAPKERRDRAAANARRMIDMFELETGWRPARALPIAGALLYSRYNFIIRFVMKQIARKAGGPTDTSQDYELTDWLTLDRFVRDVAQAAALSLPAAS